MTIKFTFAEIPHRLVGMILVGSVRVKNLSITFVFTNTGDEFMA